MSLVRFTQRPTFPSLLDHFDTPDWFTSMPSVRATAPAVNVQETETDFLLAFAVPGYTKEAFEIEVDHGHLVVSSSNEEEEATEQSNFSRKEYSMTSFKRSFVLPESVATTKISAKYNNGILTIQLPKKEEALPQPTQRIAIK